MAKLTSDLQDLRKKDIKALESLVLEIRENQFKNRMKHKTGQLTESHLLTVDRKKIAQIKTIINEKNLRKHQHEYQSKATNWRSY